MADSGRRFNYFFLYDGSKVRGEGDATREGICYFYPEETPIDKQELLCGQLAGVCRCVSELSSTPVRVLRLHRNKYAIHMRDDFVWALGCSVDVPTISVCELLDRLINLFCFYNGPVRQSYQLNGAETLATRWAQYLSYLQPGSSELQRIFTCLRTIDSTNVDPLLLLKAALILQACQRSPLVLAGCVVFRGRIVSTQMSPELTMKVMVHESETYIEAQRPNGSSSSNSCSDGVSSTRVFLTTSELQDLQSTPVHKDVRSPTPHSTAPLKKTRLSRTLSEIASSETDSSDQRPPQSPDQGSSQSPDQRPPQSPDQGPSHSPDKVSFSQCTLESDNYVFSATASQSTVQAFNSPPLASESPVLNGQRSPEATEEESFYLSFHSNGGGDGEEEENSFVDGGEKDRDTGAGAELDRRAPESVNQESHDDREEEEEGERGGGGYGAEVAAPPLPPPFSGSVDEPEQNPLIPMTLYLHRVKGLVLALLVDLDFLEDKAATEEVYHCSLASLNGLEAHLRTVPPGAPCTPGPYIFAHFDCIQSTLTTNLSGRAGGAPEHPFVRATSLLHSHFCNTETLQEAIIRSAGAAVYGTRSVAQETYFQQHGGSLRNSGIPNHQDSAFSLPTKARHRLLKHGVNLL